MDHKESFIQSTANDYDIPFDIVRDLYDIYYDDGEFYNQLEAYISNRSKN